MKSHLFLTLECQQSVAMFLFCLQQHDGWGLPQMTAVFFPLFISTWAQMKIQKFHPILQVLLSIQMSRCFFPPWRNPSFLHGIFSTHFHFSLHSTVPGYRRSLCWFFRKDIKASGRLCTHRQLLDHSGWFLKHQDHNQTHPLIAESKVSSNWLECGHKEMMLLFAMRWRRMMWH